VHLERRLLSTAQPAPSFPRHGTAAHEDQEKPVTGEAADKARQEVRRLGGRGPPRRVVQGHAGRARRRRL